MYLPARSQREEYQRIILRKGEEVRRWASENLDWTEERRIEFTHDGIGMLVSSGSWNSKYRRLRHCAPATNFDFVMSIREPSLLFIAGSM